MASKMTDEQRRDILGLLSEGHDRDTISLRVGVTPGQVSAVLAHSKMGTYQRKGIEQAGMEAEVSERVSGLINELAGVAKEPKRQQPASILIGEDAETKEGVFWDPDPQTGAANPHVLILGESGFGKTYAISCILAELGQYGVPTIVFDYGQGFSSRSTPKEFLEHARPTEVQVSREGVAINPLQLFASDIHGPVNVAQRVADTFVRVYPRVGIQQHAILRQAALDVLLEAGISPEKTDTWSRPVPDFGLLHEQLNEYAETPSHPQRRGASLVASHISTMFVFNTFRSNGVAIHWEELLQPMGRVFVIQLKGLEYSLERAVTEFLLWNLIGYAESAGPGPMRCFVVLDEAHKLSFDTGSPAEKLLREGRKFGLGLILASQQPEDFSTVAFANTATKLVFQVGDDRGAVSRQLCRKVASSHSFTEISELVTKLPRGWAYMVSQNLGRVVRILSFEERVGRWKR